MCTSNQESSGIYSLDILQRVLHQESLAQMLNFRPNSISLSTVKEVTSNKIIIQSTCIFDYRSRMRVDFFVK
jgi:hypothetical protein